jgi:hypothetical protein
MNNDASLLTGPHRSWRSTKRPNDRLLAGWLASGCGGRPCARSERWRQRFEAKYAALGGAASFPGNATKGLEARPEHGGGWLRTLTFYRSASTCGHRGRRPEDAPKEDR